MKTRLKWSCAPWAPWVAVGVMMLACGSDGTPDHAPTPDGYTLAPRVFVVSRRQANEVTVTDDRLVFPRTGNEDLLSRTGGDDDWK